MMDDLCEFLLFKVRVFAKELSSKSLDMQTQTFVVALSTVVLLALGWKSTLLFRWLYRLFFSRMIWDQKPHLLTYSELKRGRAVKATEGKSIVTMPDYPDGWFFLLESTTLKKGKAASISIFGVEVAAYRTQSGKVYCVDAYCPHLGANLGVGGQVRGECIQCPFHGWQFRGIDGRCVNVTGSDKIPESAHTSSWPVHEDNGVVYIWYHAQGSDPTWMPPTLPAISDDPYSQLQASGDNPLYCHAQEIPENGADFQHFEHVHTNNIGFGSNLATYLDEGTAGLFSLPWRWLLDRLTHHWDASWQPHVEEGKHVTSMTVKQALKLCGRLDILYVKADINQVGPGIVNFDFNLFGGLIHGTMCQFVVPVAPQRTQLIHLIFGRNGPFMTNRIGCKSLFAGFVTQVERDIVIWNHKAPRWRPLLCRTEGDERLLKFRRWFSQFYSEPVTVEPHTNNGDNDDISSQSAVSVNDAGVMNGDARFSNGDLKTKGPDENDVLSKSRNTTADIVAQVQNGSATNGSHLRTVHRASHNIVTDW